MSLSARRAVVRWSWRLFRREWRQQLLVLLLLTTTVAASIVGAAAAQSLAADPAAEFGSATHQLQLARSDPAELEAALGEMRSHFGEIDVIRSRRVAVPGSVNSVDVRSQDPTGPFGASRLVLVSGRYPEGDEEVAVTEDVAATFEVGAGGRLALEGVDRQVVGIVENPADLDDQFVLVAPGDAAPAAVTVLVRTTEDLVRSLPARVEIESIMVRGQGQSTAAAIGALGLAVVVAILVCLVAAAGFVVVAQRRLRQLGMLAAIGATERHLRLVVVANGVAVGAVSAFVGAVLAWVGWIGFNPQLEELAAHRIDRYGMPWWIVASGMALALVTATAAAWWPGRAVARVPITRALSARPPQPRQVHRSALAGLGLMAAGFAGLAFGLDHVQDKANPLLVLPGIAALVIGMLLISPLAIRALASVGRRTPIAMRLALRDLVRHQARSGVALAAITLSLGLGVTTVVIASASEYGRDEGNLSDRQVLVRLGDSEPILPAVSSTDLDKKQKAVDDFAASLSATALPLDEAITANASETRDGVVYNLPVVLGRPVGDGLRDVDRLYVATPELLGHLGLDASSFPEATDVLTSYEGTLRFANSRRSEAEPTIESIDQGAYSAAPTSLLMPAALERFGWEPARAGWLIEAEKPLTPAQITAARAIAVRAGLTVETRDEQQGLTSVKTWATAVGMALALAILAMTVGLIRVESSGEVRTLAASGATAGTRRSIVATTAGALAFLGAVLGTAGAYLALVAGYLEDLDPLTNPPLLNLAFTGIGIPLLAAGAAWLLGGREPRTMARPAME